MVVVRSLRSVNCAQFREKNTCAYTVQFWFLELQKLAINHTKHSVIIIVSHASMRAYSSIIKKSAKEENAFLAVTVAGFQSKL